MAYAMLGKRIPVPRPLTRVMNIQLTVGVSTSRSTRTPIPRTVRVQPSQRAQRKRPVMETRRPTTTDAGATVL